MKKLHQQAGAVSLEAFSRSTGVSVTSLRKYAKAGRLIGARKCVLTKKWWVYPPAQLRRGWQS